MSEIKKEIKINNLKQAIDEYNTAKGKYLLFDYSTGYVWCSSKSSRAYSGISIDVVAEMYGESTGKITVDEESVVNFIEKEYGISKK